MAPRLVKLEIVTLELAFNDVNFDSIDGMQTLTFERGSTGFSAQLSRGRVSNCLLAGASPLRLHLLLWRITAQENHGFQPSPKPLTGPAPVGKPGCRIRSELSLYRPPLPARHEPGEKLGSRILSGLCRCL